MATNSMALIELAEKHGNGDFLRELGQWTLQRLMELEVDQQIGAEHHERNQERTTHRNGYRERTLETRAGAMNLRIPKLRSGSYFPSFLEPRRRSEQALVGVIQEAYIKGVSTRKVDDLVQAMGMTGISKSQVSRLCEELDDQVKAFLNRPITGMWPYIWLDATYVKSREGAHVVSKAIVVAVGVNEEGRRDVLGICVGPTETEAFWTDFLRSLATRGLKGVRLVISDAHIGLQNAVRTVFSAAWQRCKVHFIRNILGYVPRNHQQMVAAIVRTAFVEEDKKSASRRWRETADQLRDRFPKVSEIMDECEEEVLAFMAFHRDHRRQISSTNPLERLNKEIKRRTHVIGIFPNAAAITRLVGSLMAEQSEEWHVTRRYMSRESLKQMIESEKKTPSLTAEETREVA